MWEYKSAAQQANEKLDTVLSELRRVRHQLDIIRRMGEIEMADFARLEQDVAQQKTVNDSVLTLLAGITEEIQKLRSNVSNDTETQAQLDSLAQQIEKANQSMADAVTANTAAAKGEKKG